MGLVTGRIRTALRYAAAGAGIAALAAIGAAAGAYQILDAPAWTDPAPAPAPSVRPTPVPTATPAPGRTASVGPNRLLGRCAIPTTTRAVLAPCGAPGARQVVGVIGQGAAGKRPCETTPFTRVVRSYGAYYLCLGTP